MARWEGDCSGSGATTTIGLTADKTCTASLMSLQAPGVYELVASNGVPVPTGKIDNVVSSVINGEMRINEPRADSPNANTLMNERIRARYFNGVEADWAPFWIYTVGQKSDTPVPVPWTGTAISLTPGLVLLSPNLAVGGSQPLATLSDDGMTLSVAGAPTTVGTAAHIATFVRRPIPRTMRMEPVNRRLTFAKTKQGAQSDPKSITVFNTGADPLRVSAAFTFSGGTLSDFAVTGGTCSSGAFGLIAPGGQCEIRVVFKPRVTYRTGARVETLTVYTNEGSISGENVRGVIFDVSGEATGIPQVTVNPSVVEFMSQVAGMVSDPKQVTVSNTGDVPLRNRLHRDLRALRAELLCRYVELQQSLAHLGRELRRRHRLHADGVRGRGREERGPDHSDQWRQHDRQPAATDKRAAAWDGRPASPWPTLASTATCW